MGENNHLTPSPQLSFFHPPPLPRWFLFVNSIPQARQFKAEYAFE